MLRRLPRTGLAGRYVAGARTAGAFAPINLLTGAIALTAVLLALAVRSITPPESAVALPWWILAAAFLAAERFLVHIPSRRTAHTLTFAELPLVMGLFFASPLTLLGAQLLGACMALLIDRHMSGIRRVFNLAQYGLTSAVAIMVFNFFHAGGMSVGAWAACLAAVVAASLVGIAAIVAAMTVTGDRPTGAKLTYMLLTGLAVSVTNTSLALLAAFVAWNDAMALVLLAVPITVVFLSYRAYVAQHRHAEQVEFLNLATRDLVASRTVDEGLGRLLEHSLATFHCEFAELVLFSTGPDESILRLTQWGDERGTLLPVTGPEAARLAPMSRDVSLNDVLRGYLDGRDLGDVLAARLVDENGVLGLLMVGAPSDGGGRLGPAEAKLLDTLAHQAAAVLRYERLEQAFDRLHAEQARFRHAALHDPVTGLGNRRLFGERLEDALGRRRPVAIMLVDLDDFKQVNDTLGHAAGDELLVAVSQRMRRNVRPDDLVVRLGGDEFALLLLDPDSHAEAGIVADRVLHAVAQPYTVGGKPAIVGASIGLVVAGEEWVSANQLLDRADQAMYEAKRSGKCQVRRWQGGGLTAA